MTNTPQETGPEVRRSIQAGLDALSHSACDWTCRRTQCKIPYTRNGCQAYKQTARIAPASGALSACCIENRSTVKKRFLIPILLILIASACSQPVVTPQIVPVTVQVPVKQTVQVPVLITPTPFVTPQILRWSVEGIADLDTLDPARQILQVRDDDAMSGLRQQRRVVEFVDYTARLNMGFEEQPVSARQG